MAVFTDITSPKYRGILSRIEDAFELTITAVHGMTEGTLDSKYKINARGVDGSLVLTIHETPDVSPAGRSVEEAARMLRYVDYLAGATSFTTDRSGQAVHLGILKSLYANPGTPAEAPYLILEFDGVRKCLSIVPFVKGKVYLNQPGELADSGDAARAGRSLAALFNLARSYPEITLFQTFNFNTFVEEIIRISKKKKALEAFGHFLSAGELEGIPAQSAGRDYIDEMVGSGQALIGCWHEIASPVSAYPHGLIHGDLFTDNTILGADGRLYLFDFGETARGSLGVDIGIALTSWASQNGQPYLPNVRSFLEGVDSVFPLTAAAIPMIPTLVQIGAYRWETFRIQRIISQDPDQHEMRSPTEFQSLRRSWSELESKFQSLLSLEQIST